MSIPIEIERKFVIEMPELTVISRLDGYTSSDIEQTYLVSSPLVTRRVRARKYSNHTVYTETKKIRIDRMSSEEDEREITEEEYRALVLDIKPETVTLRKTRHTFDYLGRTFEIDVYPNWERSCILEVELDSKDSSLTIPDFLRVIAEVTGDKAYSNASMSHKFPDELV